MMSAKEARAYIDKFKNVKSKDIKTNPRKVLTEDLDNISAMIYKGVCNLDTSLAYITKHLTDDYRDALVSILEEEGYSVVDHCSGAYILIRW